MDEVVKGLRASVAAACSRAYEERLGILGQLRAAQLHVAEQQLAIIQTQFVGRAQTEIDALQNGEVRKFVSQLIRKTDQYAAEAIAAFRSAFTPREWQHIQDQEPAFRRRLLDPVNAKLQEVTARQEKVDRDQYQALLGQKGGLNKQVTDLQAQLEREKRTREAERARLVAEKDQAHLAGIERGREEKRAELEAMKAQVNRQIQALNQRIAVRDGEIDAARSSERTKGYTVTNLTCELQRSRAKLRIALAYRPIPGRFDFPTEDMLDFCTAGCSAAVLDTSTLESGNRLCRPLRAYCTLCSDGSGQRVGRDGLPVVEIIGNTIGFRYNLHETRYYATSSSPRLCDSDAEHDNDSLFAPENVTGTPNGPWRLRNTGLSEFNYLRASGGEVICNGASTADASPFTISLD
jgi:hypothetical protein